MTCTVCTASSNTAISRVFLPHLYVQTGRCFELSTLQSLSFDSMTGNIFQTDIHTISSSQIHVEKDALLRLHDVHVYIVKESAFVASTRGVWREK